MNKRSVKLKKKRSVKAAAKTSRNGQSHKVRVRAAAAHSTAATSRRSAKKSPPISAVKASIGHKIHKIAVMEKVSAIEIAGVTVAQVTALSPALQTHKFQVGQTVFYTSSPITRPGASGSYKVVRLLPSDGEDYQYRIKNPGEAFERVAKESQLEVEH